jgi:hypothetical protein
MWKRFLRNDPLPALLSAEDVGLRFHVENDLLGERIQTLTISGAALRYPDH